MKKNGSPLHSCELNIVLEIGYLNRLATDLVEVLNAKKNIQQLLKFSLGCQLSFFAGLDINLSDKTLERCTCVECARPVVLSYKTNLIPFRKFS